VNGVGLITPDWEAPRGVRAAFSLRTGGVSAAPFDSLNLGSQTGDEPHAVRENQRRLAEALALPGVPAWLEQVHGIEVVSLERWTSGDSPEADASVTRTPGQVCVVRVADCMPVLFASSDGTVVGAAHAGWRGLAGGVLEATVKAMAVEPARLLAWMGPCIGSGNFEVGDEVRTAFVSHEAGNASAFAKNARGRWQCDLYALARSRLQSMRIGAISGGGWCTHADAARFFSFRRDGRTGRMAALIWMDER
jgi:YfiH family protein